MKIEEIEKFGKKAFGQRFLLKHLKGGHLSRKEAILAQCYDCTCGYADGIVDCKTPTCPLYDWMPYNKNKNKNKNKKDISPEQKKILVERMRKARESKKTNEHSF